MIRVEDVLERVSTKDGLAHYGVTFNAKGFAHCPFHTEKTASFHYNAKSDRYHCFSCGRDGTIIDFVAESFQFSLPKELPKALEKINQDFNLGLGKELTVEEKRKRGQERKLDLGIKEAERNWNESLSTCHRQWSEVYRSIYGQFLEGEESDKDLKELLERLEEALDDFSGNELRGWPSDQLTEKQLQHIRTAISRMESVEEEKPPDFREFHEAGQKAAAERGGSLPQEPFRENAWHVTNMQER